MEFNKRNATRWAVIGQRPTFGMALFEMAKVDKNIVVIVADVTNSAGLGNMRKELPEQVLNVGIAEQNMMGIATGLASEGFTVFTTSFAPFQTMRCLEQIRVNQGYMKQKVIMVGLASGMAYGELGCTHCSIEDIALIRAIPNIAVVTPADGMEVVKLVEAAAEYKDSVYIRLMDKTGIPVVYTEDYSLEIGKAVPIFRDGEITILANGPMVYPSKDAAQRFYDDFGIKIAVYDFHTIKPLDRELLSELKSRTKAVITVEEHSVIGGLGGAVCEYYSCSKERIPIYMMGIPDEYPHGASHESILEKYDLTSNGIYKKIQTIMEEMS